MFKFQNLLKAGQGKEQKKYEMIVARINELEPEISSLSDDELKNMRIKFQLRYENGERDVYKRQV